MKHLYIIMLLFVFGCKTKAITADKSNRKEFEYFVKTFDSLFEKATQQRLEFYKKQSLISANLMLTSFKQYDSLGNRKPFHYKHFIDGELKEEIYLEGGDIEKNTASNYNEVAGNVKASSTEKAAVKVDLSQNKTTKTKTADKKAKVKVTGFQFGLYAWLFLILIAFLVLLWVAKKFKLPDRFKRFLNGG